MRPLHTTWRHGPQGEILSEALSLCPWPRQVHQLLPLPQVNSSPPQLLVERGEVRGLLSMSFYIPSTHLGNHQFFCRRGFLCLSAQGFLGYRCALQSSNEGLEAQDCWYFWNNSTKDGGVWKDSGPNFLTHWWHAYPLLHGAP